MVDSRTRVTGRERTGTAGHTAALGTGLVATVVFLTAIAPLATDMYVPAFPSVAGDLAATAAQVSLTLTTFFVGMGLGQLIGGPVSDQRGRRRPLIAAVLVFTVASVACALAPSVGVMMAARLVQGFSGGWAMVIGRAVVVDLAHGAQLVRVLNVVAGVGGIAPIVGPLLGGVLLQLSGWRISFWLVAALGVAMTVAVVVAVPESLPVERRHRGGLRAFAAAGREVLTHRRYVGYLLVSGSATAALFAYVASSAFVLQTMNGLSPIAYSIDFAVNAVGMTIAALVAARLAGRVSTRRVILVGQLAALAAGVAMLAGALWCGTPLTLTLACFFVLMTAQGLIGPNGGALASAEVPAHPGTGSAVLGCVQWTRGRGGRATGRPRWRPHRGTDGRDDGHRGAGVDVRTARPGPAMRARMLVGLLVVGACAAGPVDARPADGPPTTVTAETPGPGTSTTGTAAVLTVGGTDVVLTVGGTAVAATLDDNPSARDLLDRLPLILTLRDFNGVEKTAPLPAPLSLDGALRGSDPAPFDIGYYAPDQVLVLYYRDVGFFDGIVGLGRFDPGAAGLVQGLPDDTVMTIERA